MNMVRISRYTIVQAKLAGLRSTESAARADSVIFSDLLSEGRNLIACGTHHGQGSALPVGGRGPCQRLNTALPSPQAGADQHPSNSTYNLTGIGAHAIRSILFCP